jgi:type VI secretion system protein ImpG
MNRAMLSKYEQELEHLRSAAGEFARQNPKIASRLALDERECRDPYVERLLEGFAYLAARVQLKLEAEFPRFTETLLNIIYPQYLAPVPAMAMVQFVPELTEAGLAQGFSIARGTALRSQRGAGEATSCEFRTAHEVRLLPLRVSGASYHTRDTGVLDLPGQLGEPVRAAVRIELEATAGLTLDKISVGDLPLFISAGDAARMRLYEQLLSDAVCVLVREAKPADPLATRAPAQRLSADSVQRVGYDEREGLLPADGRTFHGYRLLAEYFAFPQRFMSVSVAGLEGALRRVKGARAEIIIPLRREEPTLERAVEAETFVPFCTPAINLFTKRADRIFVTDQRPEHHVVVDRTRPIDFEVHSVTKVVGYGVGGVEGVGPGGVEREFRPFYAATDWDDAGMPTAGGSGGGGAGGAYYTLHRTARMLTQREQQQGTRSLRYLGSDVYLSLVDGHALPYPDDLRQLSVEVLCTNRDLPIQMPVGRGARDFDIDTAAPLRTIRCIVSPSMPRPAPTEGQVAWRAIGHLAQNYLSLANASGGSSPAAIRDLLRLYADESDPQRRAVDAQQVEGVLSVTSRPITRRVPAPGPVTFVRGIEVAVELDESRFEGSGVFLLGSVLERFFSRYVSSNSLSETVLRSPQRGEIKRWPAIVGRRPML